MDSNYQFSIETEVQANVLPFWRLRIRDFPGGEGESKFIGRGTIEDMQNREGRQLLGFEPFDASPDTTFIEKANLILSR